MLFPASAWESGERRQRQAGTAPRSWGGEEGRRRRWERPPSGWGCHRERGPALPAASVLPGETGSSGLKINGVLCSVASHPIPAETRAGGLGTLLLVAAAALRRSETPGTSIPDGPRGMEPECRAALLSSGFSHYPALPGSRERAPCPVCRGWIPACPRAVAASSAARRASRGA